ncbi:MAG: YjfB family protein [Lachnospiraceae bacterium]|nr:YjfB family protein [Lachnospiraceae bacterium]MDE6750629.1 YjfB family protein [Lachnospiraceae bacterium]
MDIAKLSMSMSAVQTNTAYGVAMLSKSLDAASSTGEQLVSMMDAAAMERSVNPAVGSNFDTYI